MEGRSLTRCTHTPTRAREQSLNFFAFEQQQMGNWPINCCDESRIADQCKEVSEPVGVSSVCVSATMEAFATEKLADKTNKVAQARSSLTRGPHTPTRALRAIIEPFSPLRQQQMGNWPINCCDDLGLPISAKKFLNRSV